MLERLVRSVAVVLSLFVVAGFALFALDDIDRASVASRDRVAGIEAITPSAAGERAREQRNGRVREVIDDVDDVLLSPFAGVSDTAGSRWVQRGAPTLLALLVYAFGLGYAARWLRARPGRAGAHPVHG